MTVRSRAWLRLIKQLPATFNAPKENVADKPIFRDAFIDIAASRPHGKQPYFISAADRGALSFCRPAGPVEER